VYSAPVSWSFGTLPGGRVANDVASATIAGYTFAWAGGGSGGVGVGGISGGAPGGILNVRVALRGTPLADLARALARVEGVRVTSGPRMGAGGDCYLVHCPGFKMVVSSPPPGTDSAHALVSRAPEPTVAVTSELAVALDRLMRASPAGRAAVAPEPMVASAGPASSTLRRAPLRPGKTLARKTPLTRRTPLRRGPKTEE
jgi:hypothetical protein